MVSFYLEQGEDDSRNPSGKQMKPNENKKQNLVVYTSFHARNE
jgi:hypothetical protein